jgi:photosystem II stability/assembly factor-like uncharacterized protein
VSFQELREPDTDISYNGVYFINNTVGCLAGEQVFSDTKGTVTMTTDKGKTWSVKRGLVKGRLLGVYLADAMHGWAVGEGGAAVATTDGGASWKVQTSKTTVDLYDVHFISPTKGWAVGANSTVVGTSDGGSTWNILSGGTPSGNVGEGEVMFMGVCFINDNVGFVAGAGDKGEVRQTTDGGKTWKTVATTEDGLFDVDFADALRGWAVGKFGQVVATVDGGKTWKPQNAKTEEDLITVEAGSTSNVWIAGEYGAISFTKDGGKTWSAVSVPVTIGGKTKPMTSRITGVSSKAAEAWATTDFGRVIYFILK